MCLPNILSPVFMFAFIFHCRSFSPCWPLAFLIVSQPLWIFMFFFLQNSSLLFSITRSFSVIHESVNIKNNVEKDTTLLSFFLSKSPGGNAISFEIKPWLAFGLPFLLIELFYIGMPVVRTDGRTDGRAGGRSVYGHVIAKFSRMGSYHFSLPMVLRCIIKNLVLQINYNEYFNYIYPALETTACSQWAINVAIHLLSRQPNSVWFCFQRNSSVLDLKERPITR